MRCPTVADLPPPPGGTRGWPWSTGTTPLPDLMPDGQPYPLISIVTPSLNQGQFLEHAIRSVLLQGYPRLELIVMDGGSADDSVSTIRRYGPWLHAWKSEPDQGPVHALAKGFALANGDIFAYLNADDFYLPGCLQTVASSFSQSSSPDVVSGHAYFADASGTLGVPLYSDRWDLNQFRYGACVLIQPATFFRRSAFEKAGGFKVSRSTWDMELWADCARAGAVFSSTDQHLAAFRIHGVSITGAAASRPGRMDDARGVLDRMRGRPETFSERLQTLLHRTRRFVRHPLRAIRQRLYVRTTLGRWSL